MILFLQQWGTIIIFSWLDSSNFYLLKPQEIVLASVQQNNSNGERRKENPREEKTLEEGKPYGQKTFSFWFP